MATTSTTQPLSAASTMAAGTLVSRASGVARVLVLAWVLGFTPLSDAYNLANTIPNMLYDVVLGGIATATFVPVFVERLHRDGERRAWRSISAVVTISTVVLVVASVAAFALAPWIIDAFTAFNHLGNTRSPLELAQQRDVATSLLRWFSPQILFYGLLSLSTALLNVRGRFGAPAWVPIVNNLVCIGVLLWFGAIDPAPSLASVTANPNQIVLLGLGTTAGVALQALCLGPSLVRAGGLRVRWRFDLRDEAVRAVGRLSTWTLGIVVANQLALAVVLAFAFGIGGDGPVSAYTYGWAFMQMPYAVVAVSVMSAVTPELSRRWTLQDRPGFAQRFGTGLRGTMGIILPASVGLVILAQPLVNLLLYRGQGHGRLLAGTVLAVLAAGLPGFTCFQFAIRGLQAMQRARDAFWLYVAENGLNIALAVTIGRHSIGVLTATVSIAYTVAAVLALWAVRRRAGTLGAPGCFRPLGRVAIATACTGVATLLASAATGWMNGVGLAARLVWSLAAGAATFVVVSAWLTRRARRAATHGSL
ncbi:MAG TPA: murein biosynthesis integral membrane protein MurJ [Acidimicrobiales bacterium]|nr:murein biosynthesis integral membrane protein MurJ [Acidimicrobiales bacterium]